MGGLSNFEEHLTDMIDFALYLRREFSSPVSFVLDGFQTELTVSMSFGIEQGINRLDFATVINQSSLILNSNFYRKN